MFLNYAHRGASAYAPENTMCAFRLGVALGADGIETDIRRTADGVPVLFHDESLLRLTGEDRKIRELTLDELSGIPIPSPDGALFDFIPPLTELLALAKDCSVALALELKEDGLAAEVLEMISAFGLKDRCVVTSFEWEYLRDVKALDPAQPVGLLTRSVDGGVMETLKRVGAEQICPRASLLSPELVEELHRQGFSVRPWGVADETLMQTAYRCGVDGMTVNFPDRLKAYIEGQGGQ